MPYGRAGMVRRSGRPIATGAHRVPLTGTHRGTPQPAQYPGRLSEGLRAPLQQSVTLARPHRGATNLYVQNT